MKNEIIRTGRIEIKFLLESADTNGSVAMFEFNEMATIVNAGGPPDIEKVKAVMAKHGLVPAMPGS